MIDAAHNTGIPICAEDHARIEVYALLSSLFYDAPSNEFLKAIGDSRSLCINEPATEFCRAWRCLQYAAAHGNSEAIKEEFDTTFIGTGRQPVMLYGSFYMAGFLHEKPLAQLREQLTKMGVERRSGCHESEDHISALCDVMRLLITTAGVSSQLDFFRQHISPWCLQLCAAIDGAPGTHFYKHVAALLREFFVVESAAFDIA